MKQENFKINHLQCGNHLWFPPCILTLLRCISVTLIFAKKIIRAQFTVILSCYEFCIHFPNKFWKNSWNSIWNYSCFFRCGSEVVGRFSKQLKQSSYGYFHHLRKVSITHGDINSLTEKVSWNNFKIIFTNLSFPELQFLCSFYIKRIICIRISSITF